MQYTAETRDYKGRLFRVEFHYDNDLREPWKEYDGHGIISGFETRSKRPGERILIKDRKHAMFYDIQATMKKALAQGWNAPPYQHRTKRAQAAAAVAADFKRMQDWVLGNWFWCGLVVTMLDDEGSSSNIESGLWGIESDYAEETMTELFEECLYQEQAQTYPVSEIGI